MTAPRTAGGLRANRLSSDPRGKVLGGRSSINGMICMRGQARHYDIWRQMGNEGRGWQDVLSWFRRSERHHAGGDERHGGEGELHVQNQRLNWPIPDAMKQAAVELGIPETPDFNRGHNEGVGYFPVNQRNGIRSNACKAFLEPARRRPNRTILIHAEVTGVGERLQDHRQIRTMFRIADARTLNDLWASLTGKIGLVARHALKRSGPVAMAPSELGIFTHSSPDHDTAHSEYHVQPLARFPALTVSVCNLRPQSRGSSHIRSADPLSALAIRPNYLSHPADRRIAVASNRHARQLTATETLRAHAPTEILPGPAVTSAADLVHTADNTTTHFHPVFTARMGRDPMVVVDDRLRDLARLSIADASVMPAIPSGNTLAPVTMIAEKAAAMILERAAG